MLRFPGANPAGTRRPGAISLLLLVGLGLLATPQPAWSAAYPVTAVVETEPVPHPGDAADDPCIWIHPSDTSLSTVIGTDKLGGLAVYSLDGTQIQYLPAGNINNVDIRYGFSLDGELVDLVAASNRSSDTIAVYRVDPDTRELYDVAARPLTVGITIYGFCLYRNSATGTVYAFANAQDGRVEQYRLFGNGSGRVDAELVRAFDVGTTVEGCVADDNLRHFYIGEENVGIWKYGAEPSAGSSRVMVDAVGPNLVADVEGLALYYANDSTGYLIASSQGSSTYVIYEREGDNAYVASFTIAAGSVVDNVSGTDGIDVTNVDLGPPFENGLFVAQDTTNPGGNQNFKFVRWEDIAFGAEPPLTISTLENPRNVPASRTSFGGLKRRFR